MQKRTMMSMGWIAVIAILVSAAHAAENSPANLTNRFSESWTGYEVRYPSHWVIEKPDKVTVLFAGRQGTNDYYTTVTIQNVLSTKFGGKYTNMDSVVTDLKQQFKASDPQAQFFYEGTLPFSSEEGSSVNAITFVVVYKSQNTNFKQWAVVIPRASGSIFHIFFYTSPIYKYDSNIKTAHDMLATLRLLKVSK